MPSFFINWVEGGCDDERSQVFSAVHEMLKNQYARKALKAFIVEMVPGMKHNTIVHSSTGRGDDRENLYNMWLQSLREDLPGFRIYSWMMQSSDYLPQYRLRIYTVGISAEILGDGVMIAPSLPSSATHLRTSLSSALHMGLPALCEQSLKGQQRDNLMTMKQRLLAYRPRGTEVTCCLSVDRDPRKTFGENLRTDGCVCTLRTGNEMLWILMVDSAGIVTLSRCIHPVERLSLQGFCPDFAQYLSKTTLLRCTGNACSVPVITSVFRQLLCPLANPSVLGLPNVPRPLSIWTFREDVILYLAKMRHLNTYRNEVAIVEQLLRCEGQS